MEENIKHLSYFVTIVVTTWLLVRGMGLLVREIQREGTEPGKTVLGEALVEKSTTTTRFRLLGGAAPSSPTEGSFSRVAGALGAFSLVAVFTGLGYWVLYSLFYDHDNETVIMFKEVIKFLWLGVAMFFPYAVNKFAGIFDKSSSSTPQT